ncbi:hypothetical protein PYK22_00929 [Pyrinomonas methylaliphatogenes]|jgi:hypothetical protein|uniref:Uncharacterized protein n=2 Tax=Pyrinomonas methylaliphatogenes TaxID=454194 RepID=A0A0B6WXB9_9BACT|nr:hypothetical protein PYK22_00929 [Pyrinomonas methylaliphatogenes]
MEGAMIEMERRQRRAAQVCLGAVALTLALVFSSFIISSSRFVEERRPSDSSFEIALWGVVLLAGIGSIALRRVQLGAARLRRIAATGGQLRVLAACERAALWGAALGGGIAVLGFAIALLTGEPFDMLRAALIASIAMFYNYPRAESWRQIMAEFGG